MSHTYNSDFQPASQSVNGSNTISLRYDLDGLLVGAGVDSVHRLSTNGLTDSTDLAGFTATSRQDYNSAGELANLHYSWSGGSFLESYGRDSLGRITTSYEAISGDTTRTFSFVYTNGGRLKEVQRGGNILQHFEYDSNGNRMLALGASLIDSASATYDDQDRMTRYGNTAYSYSKNGELKKKISGTDTTNYTYDELGNLVMVILPSKDRIDYLIDGRNRRVGRKVNGHWLRGWLYEDQLNPVAELDSTGAIVARYVYGSRANVPDYMVKSGKTYRLVTDQLGSVRLVVRADSRQVAERIDYDAWGKVINDTNAGFQAFGFAGGLYDQDIKLLRFGARDYDATVGRWTRKDPRGFRSTDVNLFGYAHSRPVLESDPAGLDGRGPFGFIHNGSIINLSGKCILVSGNNPNGPGQLQTWIPPYTPFPDTPFASNDIDALYVDGQVIKIYGILGTLLVFYVPDDGHYDPVSMALASMWPNTLLRTPEDARSKFGPIAPPIAVPKECACQAAKRK